MNRRNLARPGLDDYVTILANGTSLLRVGLGSPSIGLGFEVVLSSDIFLSLSSLVSFSVPLLFLFYQNNEKDDFWFKGCDGLYIQSLLGHIVTLVKGIKSPPLDQWLVFSPSSFTLVSYILIQKE